MCSRSICVVVALVAVGLVHQSASWAQSDTIREIAEDALVVCHTNFAVGVGVLVRDRQTVLFPMDMLLDPGRPVRCRLLESERGDLDAEVMVYEDTYPDIAVLHLPQELPGEPLLMSEREPALGDILWGIRSFGRG